MRAGVPACGFVRRGAIDSQFGGSDCGGQVQRDGEFPDGIRESVVYNGCSNSRHVL